MPVIVSRSDIGSAATLLFVGTLIIVVDVRVPRLDLVPDVIGGLMVLAGVLRLHGAIRGADRLRMVLVVLAVLALPVAMMETLAPITGEVELLGLTQLIGTIVLARLLAEAFRTTEPALAALWRMAYQLAIWLALVPFVAGAMIGRLVGGGQVQSPLALVLVAILAIPLIVVLHALWRTRETPMADAAAPANP